MAVSIVNSTAAEAWAAAESQTEQLEGLATALGSNWVARIEGTGGTLRRSQTYAALTVSTTDPRSIVIGAPLTDTANSTGDITRVVFRTSGGVDILTATAQSGSGPASIDFAAGGIKTACRPTLAGVTLTADAGLPLVDTPTPNVWQQLTVAPHSRKVIRTSSPTDSATYSALAAGAQADVEALSPETVQAIPLCGYNILVNGGGGRFYYSGSLHSGYRGCEVNIIDMPLSSSTVVSVAISHQPTSPPRGPNSGYAAGLGGYIYKQSYAAEGVVGYDDQTEALDWKPFIGHDWTFSTWTPTTGFLTLVAHAVQTGQTAGQPYHTGTFTITGGVLQSSHSNPSDDYTSGAGLLGLVGFDEATGKFKTWLSQLSSELTSLPSGGFPFAGEGACFGSSGLSDYDPATGVIYAFNMNAGSMNVLKYAPATHTVTVVASMVSSGATAALSGMGGADGSGDNGWLVRHLEGTEYLMLRQNLTGRAGCGLFKFSEGYGTGDARRVQLTLPGGGAGQPFEGVGTASDPLSYCVDKVGRRVFWLVIRLSGPPKIYVSSFDSLMTWTEVVTTGLSTWADAAVWHTLNRQPLHYVNGYLVLHDNAIGPNDPGYQAGAMNIKRCYVGPA